MPGVIDFESGAHDFTQLLTFAKEIGLYVILRPGPYINAEANAGGFPLWVTTGAYGELRDNDPRYTEAWIPYMTEMAKQVKPHLITNGGNVILYQIENEYSEQWLDIEEKIDNVPVQEYFELLKNNAWDNGVDVPLMHNAPNMVCSVVPVCRYLAKVSVLTLSRMGIAGLRTFPMRKAMSMSSVSIVIRRAGVAISASVQGLTENTFHM